MLGTKLLVFAGSAIVGTGIYFSNLSVALPIQGPETIERATEETIVQPAELTPLQENWLLRLRLCESGDSQNAINPKDLDGTESAGLYQFKHTPPSLRVGKRPNTWQYYVQKYDLFGWQAWEDADWENALMSGWHQHQVLIRMLSDPDVKWTQEFPACVKRLGLPPR